MIFTVAVWGKVFFAEVEYLHDPYFFYVGTDGE